MAYNAKRLQQKAAAQGNTDVRAIRGAQRKRRAQFVKERDSIHGAAALAQRATASTNTKLKGPEGRQLRQEVTARGKAIKQSIPYMLAPAQQEYKADRASLRADERDAIAGQQADVADAIAEKLENQKQKSADVGVALREAVALIHRQTLVNADPDSDSKDKGPAVPESELDWSDFEDALRSREGVDPRSARKAVKKLQRRIDQFKSAGRTASPF